MKSVLQKIEVINPDGTTYSEHGPFVNALTDSWIDQLCGNANVYLQTNQNISNYNPAPLWYLSTGRWFPIKYRHLEAGTVSGRVLYSSGLLEMYGDPSGISGYVNRPTLTGKIVKFDSGEEYYISGVNSSGQIILRSGERIVTSYEYINGIASTQYGWYYPDIKGDKVAPEGFTIWDLGRNNYAPYGGPLTSLDYYGSGAITFKNNPFVVGTYSTTLAGSSTGDIGAMSGMYKYSRTLDSPSLSSDVVLGKFSNNFGGYVYNQPVSHVNIEPPVTGLAGQILRLTYDMYLDNGSRHGHETVSMGDSVSPIISGWPTSSGYFVFFGDMRPYNRVSHGDISFGNGNNCTTQLNNPGDSYQMFFGANDTQGFGLRPLIPGGTILRDYTTSIPTPTGDLTISGRSVMWNKSVQCSILDGSDNINSNVRVSFPQDALKSTAFFKECLYRTISAYIPISIWNTSTLSGFCHYNENNGISQWAFMFYQPQQKLETHDLYFSMQTSGIRRVLEN